MSNFKSNAQEVIERLLSAYGVTTQRALAEALNVPSNNVSAWSQRNSVPGSAIIKCVLDTGADLRWLTTGELANANFERAVVIPRGKDLLNEISTNGGKAVLRRVMDAYGFTLQKQLCELLGISSGTVSTWIRRNYFPGDIVITCSLDTGASIRWLALGISDSSEKNMIDCTSEYEKRNIEIEKIDIRSGKLVEVGSFFIDMSIFSADYINPKLVIGESIMWIIDFNQNNPTNGKYLIDIEGVISVYDVSMLPGQSVRLASDLFEFDCKISEVNFLGKSIKTII